MNAICKIYLIIWCTVSTSMSTNLVSEPKVTSDRKKEWIKLNCIFIKNSELLINTTQVTRFLAIISWHGFAYYFKPFLHMLMWYSESRFIMHLDMLTEACSALFTLHSLVAFGIQLQNYNNLPCVNKCHMIHTLLCLIA